MKPINKILIANRGEIAVRIIRTCREMGIKTVAVYSEADQTALHVRMADEAHCIGPAPSAESYLRIDKIIEVAKKSDAQAIHPGYGFLSEKSAFSQACADNKIVFLGPSAAAINAMGDKITARRHADKAGVPMVPGTLEPVSDLVEIKKLAKKFGYPVLLKATAGGGGKGMRVVEKESEIESAFQMASSEALKAFGDGRMYLEKYIKNPRHVEIQIVCDHHGQGFFLFERECSLQRRHQKIIEEAPCVYLKADVREKMAEAALCLAQEINYSGVGTVEFLVDDKQDFYFLEMNTRLQVEHTVSEMITGLDFVRLQIQVGQGEKLSLIQNEMAARGHALECRIYAEDPTQGFMPSPGKILFLSPPEGLGIRHDAGVITGSEIPIYYDPMIAKLIVHAASRELAIAKMKRALDEYHLLGVKNNIGFLKMILSLDIFTSSQIHTQYLDQNPQLAAQTLTEPPQAIALAAAVWQCSKAAIGCGHDGVDVIISNWQKEGLAEALR
jgi:acetyl-CoA carboxylase biotin carboxylase subunit